MNFEKSTNEAVGVTTAFEVMLGKCYVYASKSACVFPDEYRAIYERITAGIESMDCAENVRAVMRLRYRYGHKFIDVSRSIGISYQWVYELHKTGACLLEKHLSVILTK